jgi:hypothetical protein
MATPLFVSLAQPEQLRCFLSWLLADLERILARLPGRREVLEQRMHSLQERLRERVFSAPDFLDPAESGFTPEEVALAFDNHSDISMACLFAGGAISSVALAASGLGPHHGRFFAAGAAWTAALVARYVASATGADPHAACKDTRRRQMAELAKIGGATAP